MIRGGKPEDIPEPWRLRSDEEPREVKIEVTTFKGFSPGAMHYYAEVEEERDAVWNEKHSCWQEFWEHIPHIGRKFFNNDFTSLSKARQWVLMIIEEHFSAAEYKIIGRYSYTEIDWIREGD